jgi:hypothetical protein
MYNIETKGNFVIVPLLDQTTRVEVGTRLLDRSVKDRCDKKSVPSKQLEEKIPVVEGRVIIQALTHVNALISDHEKDILLNPELSTPSEYATLAEYQWWRISELGGAALEMELANIDLLYPNFMKTD